MLNRVIAYMLLIALIGSTYSSYVICVAFRANQKYIAASLCENRGRPWLHCNGKCYLMKKIRRAEANERNKAVKDNLSDIGSFFYEGPVKYNATCNAGVVIESKLPQMVDDRYLGRFCVRIFQPPKAS